MNSGSSLSKYAPFYEPLDFSHKYDERWRIVSSSEGLGYVATALGSANPPVIKKLMVRVNLGATDAQTSLTHRIKSFFKALKDYKHCTHLDLAECQITDHTSLNYLEPMLQTNNVITHLNLRSNVITDTGAKSIFKAITRPLSSIHNLIMSRNNLTSGSMETLSKLFVEDKLTYLDLSVTEVGAEGMKTVSASLQEVTKLKSLILENCKLGDEGCEIIANRIKEEGMKSVEELNIAENHIGRVGIEGLVSNFVPGPGKNETLIKLDLSRNYFGDEGFGLVMDMMKKNDTMHTLKVNRVGITFPKFTAFCENMTFRYDQEFGPYPKLEVLDVGGNGLGDDFGPLGSMIKNKNCGITTVNYEYNDVTDFGAKNLSNVLTQSNCERINRSGSEETDQDADQNTDKKTNQDTDLESQETKRLKAADEAQRKNFVSISLKRNSIGSDGASFLAEVLKSNKVFQDLDLRNNNIGIDGAISFKKAFRSLQFKNENRTVRLHLLPGDVGVEGLNHLAIGMRESPERLKLWIKEAKEGYDHTYKRHPKLKNLWSEDPMKMEATDPRTENVFTGLERELPAELKKYRWHGSEAANRFTEFDTPYVTDENKADLSKYKYCVELYGENDEGEDVWRFLKQCTYHSFGVLQNDRGILKWHPQVWKMVKAGWGSIVANTLYRYGLLLRLQYACESHEYVKDLYLQRYGKQKLNKAFLDRVKELEINKLVHRIVSDDIQKFWETLMHQTCAASEGLTMFEFVLKYANSPVIDCVRQFLNVFPSENYSKRGSKYPAVFLQQYIAQSGKTYRDLCLASTDRFVKRYAEAKKLILFRFLEVEPIYVSKFIRLSKVEDLLLTEEYYDDERFFFMRRIADSSEQRDHKLAENEFDAHKSFQDASGAYLSSSKLTSFDAVDNLILRNVNESLDISHSSQISMLLHRKQKLNDDKLMPTFTGMYKTNLREVLDNESLAGGRDLARAQIMLRMIANSLDHFNCRDWAKVSGLNASDKAKKARIHGNVKPRNIILRAVDELPNLDSAVGYMPGKWVLSDFSRSTEHGKDYIPVPDSAYNPPEIAKRIMSSGEGHLKAKIPATEKMDVWQFGCVMFEILSGTTLFKMEGNNDLIVDEEERGELVNWLSLDDERASLILNQLKANKDDDGYKNSYISMSLNNWGAYDDKDIKKMIESGKNLVQWCLQGRPEDRPTFSEIMNHPFLQSADVGKLKEEREAEGIIKAGEASFGNSKFLAQQPHLHLVNTDFEQAGVVVKSLEQSLNSIGCRLTTDVVKHASAEKYWEEMKSNVESARIIACFLTRDAFLKPNVIKQLVLAEDYRKKGEKVHGRVLFINLGNVIDLSKDNLQWDHAAFRKQWPQSDNFQYLVKAMATENIGLSNFSLSQVNYDDRFDAWNNFLKKQFKATLLSYIQDPIMYQAADFLKEPMLDRMLTDGHLVPTANMKKFPVNEPSSNNFKDSSDLLNKKLKERKGKFLNLYFLPAHRVRKGPARVYVLANSETKEAIEAVTQIARALEAPSALNAVDSSNKHKDKLDPRNKLINKVKTSHNIKKDSHLKIGARGTHLRDMKDSVMNISRAEGSLLVVIYASAGVFKRYSKFLNEAQSERGKDFAVVLVKGFDFDVEDHKIQDEIDKFVPEALKTSFKNKNSYVPFYKVEDDPWQYDATLKYLIKEATYKMDNPTPKENFVELNA